MPSQDGNDKGPWGNNNNSPPDIDQIFRQWKPWLQQQLPGGSLSGLIVAATLFAAA